MTLEALELEIEQTKEQMEQVITSFHQELNKIRTGRANPMLLDTIFVDYYGSMMPINQLASVNVVEGRQLVIKPYDRNIIKNIIAAITKANLQVSIQDQGDYVRMIVPTLTEETRASYVKQLKKVAEEMRVRVRNFRRDINETIKKASLSLDDIKGYQEDTQKLTDEYIIKIDKIAKEKEKDLMTV